MVKDYKIKKTRTIWVNIRTTEESNTIKIDDNVLKEHKNIPNEEDDKKVF